jgi:hypothetical protein
MKHTEMYNLPFLPFTVEKESVSVKLSPNLPTPSHRPAAVPFLHLFLATFLLTMSAHCHSSLSITFNPLQSKVTETTSKVTKSQSPYVLILNGCLTAPATTHLLFSILHHLISSWHRLLLHLSETLLQLLK